MKGKENKGQVYVLEEEQKREKKGDGRMGVLKYEEERMQTEEGRRLVT